ncbi:hypothetical protein CEXT_176151 [Caerostris extrusa]|uniref:Uncharacterized protein n=1 Tax=Caerostris extrusa TaxID=172846 RepID=A0AAV4USC8_CAEEX|nr:hypothetical protein CEXT_176151 [Caerostris extrusa]
MCFILIEAGLGGGGGVEEVATDRSTPLSLLHLRQSRPVAKEGRFSLEFQTLFFIGSAAVLLCGGFSRQDHTEDFSQEFDKTFPPTQAVTVPGKI